LYPERLVAPWAVELPQQSTTHRKLREQLGGGIAGHKSVVKKKKSNVSAKKKYLNMLA
jgi:hypothetical protein